MGQATEDWKVVLNILAEEGIEGDIQKRFARAKSMMHRMDSNSLLQAQSKMSQNQGVLAPESSPVYPSINQGEIIKNTNANPMENV